MEIIILISLIFFGLLISFICSMVGLGGGILFIPILILLYKIPSQDAIGISIFAMSATTTSATIGYFRYKCIDWKLGLMYDIFDLPGVIIGALITSLISDWILELICGCTIIILGSIVVAKRNNTDRSKTCTSEEDYISDNSADNKNKNKTKMKNIENLDEKEINTKREANKGAIINETYTQNNLSSLQVNIKSIKFNNKKDLVNNNKNNKNNYDYSYAWRGKNLKFVIISSFFGGLITGMVGMGGGTTDTTTMVLLGVPINIAAGSSSFAMLLTNLAGFISHMSIGNIIWEIGVPLAISAFVGAQIGSHVSIKANKNVLRKILGALAIFSGIRLLL
ncbi:MAG: sulfite exporter TauE/SafE family protein [Promethearchaeota archaeon]